jgi:hypothetical protein
MQRGYSFLQAEQKEAREEAAITEARARAIRRATEP